MVLGEIVTDIIRQADQGIDSVYFVACGGSWLAQYPARYLLERESKTLRVGHFTGNEFVHAAPKGLGKRSIAVFCSLMGTPETEEACRVAKAAGALTIAFCGNPEADMSKTAHHLVPFKSIFEESTQYMQSNTAQTLYLAFELLHQLEGYAHYADAVLGFENLQSIAVEARRAIELPAEQFAQAHQNDKLIYSVAGGPAMGVAYGFSICSMMEMQWINAPLINTGEFFHGPFEIVDRTLPFLLFLSEGRNRPVDLRAMDFLERYAQRVTVIDAKELYINRLNDTVCEYFNHFVFDVAQRRLLDHMSRLRGHDKMTRRYMWKVAY